MAALLLVAADPKTIAADDPPAAQYSEEQVKAAILVGFAKTTEWPAGTFKDGPKHFVIGIVGKDTLGEKAIAPFLQPSPGGAQTVEFRVVTDDAGARACHVLFVPRSERRRGRELLERLQTAPILTVGESEEFLDQSGMVNLVVQDGKMKYEINLNAAKAAGLRIPIKVLRLAPKVRGKYD